MKSPADRIATAPTAWAVSDGTTISRVFYSRAEAVVHRANAYESMPGVYTVVRVALVEIPEEGK